MQEQPFESPEPKAYGFAEPLFETQAETSPNNSVTLDIEFQTSDVDAKGLGKFLIGLDAALNMAARELVAKEEHPWAYAEGNEGRFLRVEIVEMRTGSLFSRLRVIWDDTCKHPVGSGVIVAAICWVATATGSWADFPERDRHPPPPKTVEEQMFDAIRDMYKSGKDFSVHFRIGDTEIDVFQNRKEPKPPIPEE